MSPALSGVAVDPYARVLPLDSPQHRAHAVADMYMCLCRQSGRRTLCALGWVQ
jgi:hypothetical protein